MKVALTLLTLLAWAGIPSMAVAQTQSRPPITINTCAVLTGGGTGPVIAGIQITSSSAGIRIQYTNESHKTADVVNFAVDSDGQKFVIRDVGTFSPGIEIDHKFRNGAGQAFVLPQFISPRISCTLASVRFTDGTIWRTGEPEQPAEAAPSNVLSAAPAQITLSGGSDGQIVLVSSKERIAAFTERDNCSGVASIAVAATGESTSAYRITPVAAGACSATVVDELGNTLKIPIVVR